MPKSDPPIKRYRIPRRGKKLPLTGYFAPKAASSQPSENSGSSSTTNTEVSAPAARLKNQVGGWWCPQDIFDPKNWPDEDLDGLAGEKGLEVEPLVSAVDQEDSEANVLVETLDEAAIAAQVVSFTAQQVYTGRQISQHMLFLAYHTK